MYKYTYSLELAISFDIYSTFLYFKICLLIWERERGREERERNIDSLPPIWAPPRGWTWNLGLCPDWHQTPNLFVHGMTLPPTEPPGQGYLHISNGMPILLFLDFSVLNICVYMCMCVHTYTYIYTRVCLISLLAYACANICDIYAVASTCLLCNIDLNAYD